MTPERQQLVQDSWGLVEPDAIRMVELAVRHFLAIAPAAHSLVPNDQMPTVCQRVADVIAQIVGSLDEPGRLVPLAIRLGRTNPDHGISARFYPAFGEALVSALQIHLGTAFTLDVQTAWLECHHLVSAIMRRGEQARTGEFERIRTGEYAAYQNAAAKEVNDPLVAGRLSHDNGPTGIGHGVASRQW